MHSQNATEGVRAKSLSSSMQMVLYNTYVCEGAIGAGKEDIYSPTQTCMHTHTRTHTYCLTFFYKKKKLIKDNETNRKK